MYEKSFWKTLKAISPYFGQNKNVYNKTSTSFTFFYKKRLKNTVATFSSSVKLAQNMYFWPTYAIYGTISYFVNQPLFGAVGGGVSF